MRVIAGKCKGHKLVVPQGLHIRPSSGRVRTVLFDMLGNSIEGCRILDLFSGSGSLGIEALSRGCEWVDFVEQNQRNTQSVIANLKKTHLNDHGQVINADAFVFLSNCIWIKEKYDLILADPPYHFNQYNELLYLLAKDQVLSENGRIIIEKSIHSNVLCESDLLTRVSKKNIGDTMLLFFERK